MKQFCNINGPSSVAACHHLIQRTISNARYSWHFYIGAHVFYGCRFFMCILYVYLYVYFLYVSRFLCLNSLLFFFFQIECILSVPFFQIQVLILFLLTQPYALTANKNSVRMDQAPFPTSPYPSPVGLFPPTSLTSTFLTPHPLFPAGHHLHESPCIVVCIWMD